MHCLYKLSCFTRLVTFSQLFAFAQWKIPIPKLHQSGPGPQPQTDFLAWPTPASSLWTCSELVMGLCLTLFTVTMPDPDPDLLTCVPALSSELPHRQGIDWHFGLSVEDGSSPSAALPCSLARGSRQSLPCWPLWGSPATSGTLCLREQLACLVTGPKATL